MLFEILGQCLDVLAVDAKTSSLRVHAGDRVHDGVVDGLTYFASSFQLLDDIALHFYRPGLGLSLMFLPFGSEEEIRGRCRSRNARAEDRQFHCLSATFSLFHIGFSYQ